MQNQRPQPPKELFDMRDGFIPDPAVEKWARATFIDPDSPLYNEDHAHLLFATIGVLWTNVPNNRKMKTVGATAEIPKLNPSLGTWVKARNRFQLTQWFDGMPDFLITINAPITVELSDDSFMALVEHELYHCGFKGFTQRGKPIWMLKGHDVEEFIGVVKRYGAAAGAAGTAELIEAAKSAPSVTAGMITAACGTC